MNSFLGGLTNIMNMTKGNMTTPLKAAAPQQPSILMQAIGAALRHESPQQFMLNLAQTHPQLKQYDLTNLQQTAQQVCQDNNVDIQSAINQLDNITSSMV